MENSHVPAARRAKLLNLLLILSSFTGYLEWGHGNKMFLIQGEAEVLSRLVLDPVSAIHPFTILPLLGQTLLLAGLFRKQPGQWLTFSGMAAISSLLLLMFVIGILSLNIKITASALPFILISMYTMYYYRKKHKVVSGSGIKG